MNAKKQKKTSKLKDAEYEMFIRDFYTMQFLMYDILEFVDAKFKKEFNDLDLMNVAIFTLHGIVCAETDDEKAVVKEKLCDMVDNPMHLNEWLFTNARCIKAYNETFYDAIKTGNVKDLDAELDKAVDVAEFKAYNEEMQVVKRFETLADRFEIKGGA